MWCVNDLKDHMVLVEAPLNEGRTAAIEGATIVVLATPPTTANANNVNLIENIERLKLVVEKILPLHGRVVPVADLYTAASRKL
jgi:hypothetical protein